MPRWNNSNCGFQKGQPVWNKGLKGVYHTSEETKSKLSQIHKGKHYSQNTEFKSDILKKLWQTPQFREKMIICNKPPSFKSCLHSNSTKQKLSLAKKGKTWEEIYGIEETKKKMEKFKELLRNPEIQEKRIRNVVKGLMKRPTSLELDMIKIIERNHLPLKYVGDGNFWVGHLNPDFIETTGTKICVEVSNRVLRDELSYANPRIEKFRNFGWKCFVFFGDNKNKLNEKEIRYNLAGAQL